METSEKEGGGEFVLGRRNFLGASVGALAGSITPIPARAQPSGISEKLFPGFRRQKIETSGTTINLVVGGSGPPVLLLHGFPATHLMWHRVAPDLAKEFTVVAADLRGYGDSGRRRTAKTTSAIPSAQWRRIRWR